MKLFFRKIILIAVCLIPLTAISQEVSSKDKAPATSRAQRKIAKQKWKEQRMEDMQHKKDVKAHHKRLQTKKTLKEMKKEKRKSEKLKKNKRENFLVRWFKYRN